MLRSLHRWLGLALSLLVIVISTTGILLVWSPEYVKLTVPEARSPIVDDLESLGQAVDNILTTHPAKTVRLIEFNPRDLGVHKVVLQDAHYAWHDQSGGLIQAWASNERLEDWLLDLHHRFLLGYRRAEYGGVQWHLVTAAGGGWVLSLVANTQSRGL